jgi:hypothetical protein
MRIEPHLLTDPQNIAPPALWEAHLRRTGYAEDLIRDRKIELDRLSLALLRIADGTRPLRALAIGLHLDAEQALSLARRLVEAGLVVPIEPPPPLVVHDPLEPKMRQIVRRLRPILTDIAGPEAAFALELDAPECRDAADLIIRMRRRFLDPQLREQFMVAARLALQPAADEPPVL